MAYFLYARKSEADDGRQIQSIGDQLKIGLALAKDAGVSVVDVFEEARSAKRPGRLVFCEMIARIEKGEADGIIAWHPDRLARNAVDAGLLIDLLDRGKLRDLKFQSYKFENTPEGKWMLNIVLGQSKYYVDKLSKDAKRGIRSKLEKGHYPQRALPGYVNNLVDHTIESDPERFEMIQKAMKLVLTGAYSVPEVLDVLNSQWGFRTRKTPKTGGRPLSRTTFYDMLTNIFYTGLMEHDGQIYQGRHLPMLTQHEFDEIQCRLGRKVILRQKKEFDFTGLMRCGTCGCLITAETKTKSYKTTGRTRTYTYYHCTNGKGGCSKQSITQEQIESQITTLLGNVTMHPQVVQWCLKPAQRWHEQESGFSHTTLDTLRKELTNAERRKSNLFNDRFTNPDTLTNEEFIEHKELVQGDINRLKKEIKKAEEKLEAVRQTVENVFDFAVNAQYNFEQGDAKLRKEIAARLGINYCLTLGKLTIEAHPLLVPILTLEPAEKSYHNKKDGPGGAVRPSWLAIPDEIRTLAIDSNLLFPKIEWRTS